MPLCRRPNVHLGFRPPPPRYEARAAVRRCRVCGCTDTRACTPPPFGDPCHWVAADLCSACIDRANEDAAPDRAPDPAIVRPATPREQAAAIRDLQRLLERSASLITAAEAAGRAAHAAGMPLTACPSAAAPLEAAAWRCGWLTADGAAQSATHLQKDRP